MLGIFKTKNRKTKENTDKENKVLPSSKEAYNRAKKFSEANQKVEDMRRQRDKERHLEYIDNLMVKFIRNAVVNGRFETFIQTNYPWYKFSIDLDDTYDNFKNLGEKLSSKGYDVQLIKHVTDEPWMQSVVPPLELNVSFKNSEGNFITKIK